MFETDYVRSYSVRHAKQARQTLPEWRAVKDPKTGEYFAVHKDGTCAVYPNGTPLDLRDEDGRMWRRGLPFLEYV